MSVAMSVAEFVSSLSGRDTSRDLAVQLVEVYRVGTRGQTTTTAYSGGARR